MKKYIIVQFFILLVGTLFAWTNFTIELIDWLNDKFCTTGCALTTSTNPFLTSCFYGAIFFTIAFILSAVIFKKSKNQQEQE